MTRSSTLLLAVAACAKTPAPTPLQPIDAAHAAEIVAAPDRTAKDHELDKFRKPADLLVFTGVAPGMHVADLGAGGGYSTELVARAIGPSGTMIAQDSPHWDGPELGAAWKTRLAKPVLANTQHVLLPWEQPLPAGTHDLDLVTFVAAYHDVVAEKDDATKLDAAVFGALKSGGIFIVIDNSAKSGSGKTACEPLHRIDEQVVRDEVLHAGFKLVAEGSFLRNVSDPRDWNADPGSDPRSHTQDLFVLKFKKP